MKSICKRTLNILPFALFLVLQNTQIAYAADGAAGATMDSFLSAAESVLRLLRSFVVPFMILSIAGYGIELLEAALLSEQGKRIDELKKKSLYMILAAALLCGLPNYIGWAASISMPFSWQPPAPGEMEGPGWQYYEDLNNAEDDDSNVWFDHDDSSSYDNGVFDISGSSNNE